MNKNSLRLSELIVEKQNPHIASKGFKDMPQEFVYEQGKDLTSVLYNIVVDIREENDQSMVNDWSISPNQLKGCDIRIHGTGEKPRIEFRVSEFQGGYRVPAENPCTLADRAKDTVKLLDKFEKSIKKEFKKRTGKTLTIKKPELRVDWQLVALNGLYQFVALRIGEIGTELPSHEWESK